MSLLCKHSYTLLNITPYLSNRLCQPIVCELSLNLLCELSLNIILMYVYEHSLNIILMLSANIPPYPLKQSSLTSIVCEDVLISFVLKIMRNFLEIFCFSFEEIKVYSLNKFWEYLSCFIIVL